MKPEPRTIPVIGDERVHILRNLQDMDRIKEPASGRKCPADFAVLSIGVRPDTALVKFDAHPTAKLPTA